MKLHDYVVNYICKEYRGGFAAALGDAFCRADLSNQRKLVAAFPDIFSVPAELVGESEILAKSDLERRRKEDFEFMVLCEAKGNMAMYRLLRDRSLDTLKGI